MEIELFSLLAILCLGVHSSSEMLLRQKRSWIIESFGFNEGYSGPFPFPLGRVNIDETQSIFQIHGQGVDKEPRNIIGFNSSTGDIYVLGTVDREKYDILKLTFLAHDKKTYKTESQLAIDIHIFDTNDNPPLFEHQKYNITIEESTLQGTDLITVKATDGDSSEKNRKFTFSIDSVTPTPEDLEFFINKVPFSGYGRLSFKGCLNYEKDEKYVVIVTATDDGKPKPLSSSCTIIINIEDGNNHLPEFTEQTPPEDVKEGRENVLVSRLQVTDKDTRGTRAWKAKYKILGDKNNNFRIATDPETNEGHLYVEKQLDFEDGPVKNITITVENEIPYFTCKVKNRNSAGLWTIETSNEITFSGAGKRSEGAGKEDTSSYNVIIKVEDVNEPPVFNPSKKRVSVPENNEVGQYLETFSATDPDVSSANKIKYIKGADPAGCLAVDPETGNITTSKILDRESPFVQNGVYVATIYAVEDGEPPLTGTATLSIHINDVNDNAPLLTVNTIDMCQSDETSHANITALDLDEEPYSGPFRFKLLEDTENKWRVEPNQGYSVSLVKENTVYSGHHELLIEVSDRQGKTAVHVLSVTVCDCLNATQPNCRHLKVSGSTVRGPALGTFFFCTTLFAGFLLFTCLVSCKYKKMLIPVDPGLGPVDSGHLIMSNTEEPGNDCKVPFELTNSYHREQMLIRPQVVPVTTSPVLFELLNNSNHGERMPIRSRVVPVATPVITDTVANFEAHLNGTESEETSSGTTPSVTDWMRRSQYRADILLKRALEIKLDVLEEQGAELGDYEPVVYADEGHADHNYELEAIYIPAHSLVPDFNLDSKFFSLVSVCCPAHATAQGTKI